MAFSKIGAYQYYTSIGDTETASKYSSTDAYGTVNNPMVIRNIYEFSNTNYMDVNQNDFYMIMVKDINMDDYPELDKLYSNPFQNAIVIESYGCRVHIDFNGYCIRNLLVRNFTFQTQSNYAFIKFTDKGYDNTTLYLDNVKIENFVISNFTTTTTTSMNYSLFWNSRGNIVINNMYVSIYHNRDKSLAITGRYNMFSLCIPVEGYTTKIFNLYTKFSGNINKNNGYNEGNQNSLLYVHSRMRIYDWTIDFRDFYWIDTNPAGADNLLYINSANIDTVHIVGKLNYIRSNSGGNGTPARYVCILNGSTVTNILCDAEINHTNKEKPDHISSSNLYDILFVFNSSSFINKDKVKFSESYSKIGDSIKCTTEQLKDPAFLTENGLVFMQT